jgi:hypothetical protein
MAHHEACQLYIEQQIQDGLSEGKSPYSIGKELAAWVEKLFETSIPANTLERRARRHREKLRSNVRTSTTPSNYLEIQKFQVKGHGGARDSAGRPAKFAKPIEPYSCAMQMATIAISQLSRIMKDDPKREEAFQEVIKWINDNS